MFFFLRYSAQYGGSDESIAKKGTVPKYSCSAVLCLVTIVGAFLACVQTLSLAFCLSVSFVRSFRSFVHSVSRLLADLISRSFLRSPNLFLNKNI